MHGDTCDEDFENWTHLNIEIAAYNWLQNSFVITKEYIFCEKVNLIIQDWPEFYFYFHVIFDLQITFDLCFLESFGKILDCCYELGDGTDMINIPAIQKENLHIDLNCIPLCSLQGGTLIEIQAV